MKAPQTVEGMKYDGTEWSNARATIQLALMDPDNACLGVREAERAYDIAQEALAALAQDGYIELRDPEAEDSNSADGGVS